MLAFAANSLLCRLALQHKGIDAASFGSIRLVAGALMLGLIVRLRARPLASPARADWLAAVMLFGYVAFFSFAYLSLSAGTGALTSGLGYAVWYAALGGLTAMRAATVQLSVPLLAAFGGVLFLSESITPRLAAASVAILGGIALVLSQKSRSSRP